jgi:hypothetical protein
VVQHVIELRSKSVILLGEASVISGRFIDMADALLRAGIRRIEPGFPPVSDTPIIAPTTLNGMPMLPVGPVIQPGGRSETIAGIAENYEARDVPSEEPPPPPGD